MAIFRMSTMSGDAKRNSELTLDPANPVDLTPAHAELVATGIESPPTTGWVWGFRPGTQVARGNPRLPAQGDLAVRLRGSQAHPVIDAVFEVLAVFFGSIPGGVAALPGPGTPAWRKAHGFAEHVVVFSSGWSLQPPVNYVPLANQHGWDQNPRFPATYLAYGPGDAAFLGQLLAQAGGGGLQTAPANWSPIAPKRTTKTRTVVTRDPRFREKVIAAYGVACGACEIRWPWLLEAAHLVDHSQGGAAESWNGLPLCRNHHKLLDDGDLVLDEVKGFEWVDGAGSPASSSQLLAGLGVTRADIGHLTATPDVRACAWKRG